jgi:hypothetical protein
MPQRASVFCNFYIRVDREALVSERALNVGSVAFKAMSTKNVVHNTWAKAYYRSCVTDELGVTPSSSAIFTIESCNIAFNPLKVM